MDVKFTYIKTIFDNEILPQSRHEMSWDKFCKILSKPQIVNNKDDAGLISPVEYLSEEECLDFTDSGKVRRCSDNVKTFYAIPADIDGNMTIATAKERFKDYQYILYTTFSHKSAKKDFKDCFRIFFKIKEPISNADFLCRRAALQDFILEQDRTALATSRGFYIPSCSQETAHHAVYYHNQGIDLDVLAMPVTVEIQYTPDTSREAPTEEFKAIVLEQLGKLRIIEYSEWWKLSSALYNSGYSFSDFEQLSNTIRSHRKNNSKSQWNISKKKGIGFGYLINLCKANLGEDCFKGGKSSKFNQIEVLLGKLKSR